MRPTDVEKREKSLKSWTETNERLRYVNESQLFFVGGAPRSGTTWLQQIIDCHPDACCKGEGLFSKDLFPSAERLIEERRKALEAKNHGLFQHTGGYPLPTAEDAEFLAATTILMALRQQAGDKDYLAYGEKTPENAFFFPRFLALFPRAKFIGIARDPRDVLTSAWYFFRKSVEGQDMVEEKLAFIRMALPSLAEGTRAMLSFERAHPDSYRLVTYETLRQDPAPAIAALFRFLGLSAGDDIVADCLEQTSFAKATGGRPAGVAQNGSFMRKGVVGDWRSTLTPEMNELILRELGWSFAHYGWPV